MIKIIFALIFFISCNKIALAKNVNFSIGLSSIYTNVDDPNYSFVDKYETIERINFNVGLTTIFDKINITAQTNRLVNSFSKRTIIDRKTQNILQSKTKITADTLLIGYRFNRIIPAITLSNIKSEKLLYYKNILRAQRNNYVILYGLNLSYFFTKNINSSIFYIMPNKELHLKDSFGFGINYIF